MTELATLKVFNHARLGRVCVYQQIPPSGRVTWCSRSDVNGCWMPCGNPHPATQVIHVPVDHGQAAGLLAAIKAVEQQVASEETRLTTVDDPDPWRVPMLGNYLGGIKNAAAVLRLEAQRLNILTKPPARPVVVNAAPGATP